jgi:hypothetical protein
MRTSLSTAAVVSLATMFAGSPIWSDATHPSPDPVRIWNELALDTVRVDRASDAQAARLYAMVNVAMYDAVNGIVSRHGAQSRRGHALVPSEGAPAQGNEFAAASAAAHAVLAGESSTHTARYDEQLAADLAALPPGDGTTAGREWGAQVGAEVREARATDGSKPNETQPAGAGPGEFRAPWSGVQFRDLLPFGIDDPPIYVGSGPPALGSLDYAAAYAEIKLVGDAAIRDDSKLAIFQYWSLAAGTSQPPGAWVQTALVVSGDRHSPLAEKARLLALVSMALSDTVAPTYMTKFVYRHWRPTTAIREADTDGNPLTDPNPGWSPRAGGIGTSPEYWSGHSTFSGAASAALAGFFCNDGISFSLVTDSAPGGSARTYPSFSAAANEAGRSRVGGGIHFEFSNQEALAVGRAIAAEILAKKALLQRGPTHFGSCPL